jgi:hypothetical protein
MDSLVESLNVLIVILIVFFDWVFDSIDWAFDFVD